MNVQSIINEATNAANAAGKEWMDKATVAFLVKNESGNVVGELLDLCGNAHVRFTDKRSAAFKEFKKAGAIRYTDNGVVEINHNYIGRQEYGLKIACAEAAKSVLNKYGIDKIRVWSYID